MDEFKVPTTVKSVAKIAKNQIDVATSNVDEPEPVEQQIEKPVAPKAQSQHSAQPPKTPLKTNIPYKEPTWSQQPKADHEYKFEVLKSGQIIDEVQDLQSKAFWLFGRFPENHIEMAHPTISRYHAVLQFRPKQEREDEDEDQTGKEIEEGWYVYDLGSTHGTFVNKLRIPPKTYIRMRVGHMLKFGASTRCFILHGPEFDAEPETEETVTELKEKRKQQEEDRRLKEEMQEKQREKEGVSWGMMEDAEEETDLSVNPYASTNNEELFLDDPKKTLRGFFEREGLILEYKCDEMSVGTFVCRVELPVDDTNGRPIVAEVCHKGKKKDCVVQCALEACRILDRHGVLRQSHHEPLKRKLQKADSDDDDDFLDRTGDIERKKSRKSNTTQSDALTHEDLLAQETELMTKIASVNQSMEQYHEQLKRIKESKERENDDLDSFMENLSSDDATKFDKLEIRRLRIEEQRLKSEHEKVQRLIKLTQPLHVPMVTATPESGQAVKKQFMLPLFGKRNKSKYVPVPKTETKRKRSVEHITSHDNETEQDEEEEESIPKAMESTVIPPLKENDKQTDPEEKKDRSAFVLTEEESTPKVMKLTENPPLEESNNQTELVEVEEKKYGPAFVPPETSSCSDPLPVEVQEKSEVRKLTKENSEIPQSKVMESNKKSDSDQPESSSQSKKRRARQRARNKRENVDIDDVEEYEDMEKYSGWIPPENQTGDGLTELNRKLGY